MLIFFPINGSPDGGLFFSLQPYGADATKICGKADFVAVFTGLQFLVFQVKNLGLTWQSPGDYHSDNSRHSRMYSRRGISPAGYSGQPSPGQSRGCRIPPPLPEWWIHFPLKKTA
jgi:hypothetical protein